ncbi:hypothetical protein OS493_010552 [Desmophyllum pertusum]|uniref:Uncharacterized protein n=1 Tax=Desmophyllum pertusum TaxID=174260 RepID=A0A9X0DAU1_9CNID|nr:hypothetical protein OS493_010552 [Desmophyllum pertusum]
MHECCSSRQHGTRADVNPYAHDNNGYAVAGLTEGQYAVEDKSKKKKKEELDATDAQDDMSKSKKSKKKRKSSLQFKSRLAARDIPPPEASWIADSSQYPKVTRAMIKKYQALKRQGSLGKYRKALRMFNSRKVKTVKVFKEGKDTFIKAHIFKSFTPTTNNGITRPAVVLFRNGTPIKCHCQWGSLGYAVMSFAC